MAWSVFHFFSPTKSPTFLRISDICDIVVGQEIFRLCFIVYIPVCVHVGGCARRKGSCTERILLQIRLEPLHSVQYFTLSDQVSWALAHHLIRSNKLGACTSPYQI